jgi:hypothetical protein
MTPGEVIFAAAVTVAFAAVVATVVVVVYASGDGDGVADVQRYIALTNAAHRLIPPGPALSDPEGETSAAIGRFLAAKEEARQALWASRRSRAPGHAAVSEPWRSRRRERGPALRSLDNVSTEGHGPGRGGTTDVLGAPAARLHYESAGSGPPLVLAPRGNGTAERP